LFIDCSCQSFPGGIRFTFPMWSVSFVQPTGTVYVIFGSKLVV
jgi:hypothetical protein